MKNRLTFLSHSICLFTAVTALFFLLCGCQFTPNDEVARFGPGDVEMADEDLDHQPIAVEGEDCICLAVTDAPLKFQTFVHKLVQPFLKI